MLSIHYIVFRDNTANTRLLSKRRKPKLITIQSLVKQNYSIHYMINMYKKMLTFSKSMSEIV